MKQVSQEHTGHRVELLASITITSEVISKLEMELIKIKIKMTAGVMSAGVSSGRRIPPSTTRLGQKESFSCPEAAPGATGGAPFLER